MFEDSEYLNTIDDDTILWRYMNFTSFYSVVRNKSLFFRRLDRYPDQFEGTLSDQTIKKLYEYRSHFPDANPDVSRNWSQSFAEDFIIGKSYVLSNAWTISDHENYALWKIYLAGSKEGVAIKSTGRRLKYSLQDNDYKINLVKVSYDETGIKFKDINIYRIATTKNQAYSYESECRALITRQYKYNKNDGTPPEPKFSDGTEVPVDLEILIDQIYVSPFAGKWFYEIVESLVADNMKWFNISNLIHSSIKER